MEEKKTKANNINFFKKLWYSITKFEKYPDMALEGVSKAIKYLMILTIIVAIFSTVGPVMNMHELISNLAQYIEENIPDFTFADGKISMDIEEPLIINDVSYDKIDKILINPIAETDEQREQFENDETIDGTTIFFFDDEIVIKYVSNEDKEEQKYTYNDFLSYYTKNDITTFNKADLVNYIRSDNMSALYFSYGLTIFVGLFLTGVIYAFLDTLEVAVFGYLTASLAKIKMKFANIYSMSIYAFTLSIMLNIIYIIVNYFTDFTIKYFEIAYTSIAYIYLATAIFILKDDFIRKMQEVIKIKQEQKNVRDELKQQDEKENEDIEERFYNG